MSKCMNKIKIKMNFLSGDFFSESESGALIQDSTVDGVIFGRCSETIRVHWLRNHKKTFP